MSDTPVPSDQILFRIRGLLGEDRVQLIRGEQFRVSQEDARVVVFPADTDELREVIEIASSEKWKVVPAGSGSWLDMGNAHRKFDFVISTAKMSRILEYEPADLTATVQAGCNLSTFNRITSEHRQFIPLDPFGSEDSTIGSIIATASAGPLRCAYGTPRDWVIGMSIVHAGGRLTKAGGKVVKNVAGYDLCKLYTGSFGTLGLISEISFKLRALPSSDQTFVVYAADSHVLCSLIERVYDSDLSPAALELIAPGVPDLPIESGKFALIIRFLSEPETARWQIGEAGKMAGQLSHILLSGPESVVFWQRYHETETASDWEIFFKISSLPADLGRTIDDITRLLPETHWRAHAANGVVRVLLTPDQVKNPLGRLDELRRRAQARGGTLVLLRAGEELKSRLDPWGNPGPAGYLMKQIKEKYDPDSILNPGMFVAGI